jgi:hypothetical protein
MTHGAFEYNNKKNALDDEEPFGLSSFFVTQEKLAQDDDELRGLSSFCATKKKKHKMTTSFLACCHLL